MRLTTNNDYLLIHLLRIVHLISLPVKWVYDRGMVSVLLRQLKRPWVHFSVVVLLMAGSFAAGFYYCTRHYQIVIRDFYPIREKAASNTFVSPILAYHVPEATKLGKYQQLKNLLTDTINVAKQKSDITRASVYFRDLNTGDWIGINQDDTYYPASLLKVPVLIAYLKQAETQPSITQRRFQYDPALMPTDPYEATSTLVAWKSYSVNDLLRRMITDSDNGATFTLLHNINPEYLDSVYTSLGIPNPGDDSSSYQISGRTYAFFFRTLYNATYLSVDASQKALELLADATFADGLRAGVPKGIAVAHKFGEHVFSHGGSVSGVELSDCGIIYYPQHPYLLCVMTSAHDHHAATTVIGKVSQVVYDTMFEKFGNSVARE